ncbi:MAG: xanthine dehydrogenase family protein subunit M [Ilumatobacteraceae bacterium]|jgi:carbon-monoxide dehydrogenase medium subunit
MQTPPPFEYERATSVGQALELLERLGPDARLIAGGHSLLPMMKLRLARPEHLVDINDLAGELGYVRIEGDELCIGAMCRHADLLASAVAGEHFRILHDAERVIADPVVRNRGTVGGSLGQADPSEDLSAAFAAAHANVVIASSSGTRTVPARELVLGPYETAVGPAEMITEIRLAIKPGSGSAYQKVERRAGDWAVAAAGACVWMDGDVVREVGIGLTAVGAEHHCAPAAEEVLRGKALTDALIDEAGAAAAAGCSPSSDQRGPEDYKRHLAGELTKRALRSAVARSRGQEG